MGVAIASARPIDIGNDTVGLTVGRSGPVDQAILSEDERSRASRLHHPEDQQRFIARHVALRSLLGTMVGRDPAALRFRNGPHGRPELLEDDSLSFSTSSAGDVFVIATCHTATVGVDVVEAARGLYDFATAQVVLHPNELHRIEASPDQDRTFANLWARKEAFAKVDGRGLGKYLRTVDLSNRSHATQPQVAVADMDADVAGVPGCHISVAVGCRVPR